jgi:hypothetical protein
MQLRPNFRKMATPSGFGGAMPMGLRLSSKAVLSG